MSDNNEILKKTLRHYIDLEYYANGVAEDLDELLEELYRNCDNAILANDYLKTKADYNAVHSVIEDYFTDFQNELNDRLEKEAETVKENERDFLTTLYGAALTVGAVSLAKILFAPFDGRDTVKTFAERSVKNIRRAYDTAVRSGYMFGQSSADVKEQAGRNLKQITRWINNGITTAIPSFAKTTDRIVFLNNDVEVVWVSTLDGHTCIRCSSLSGLHFKSISVAPSLPQHCACRCQLIPANSVSEPIPTYQEFIESLDEDEQKQVLGTNRFEMWKRYDIPLERFVNNGNVVPLDELRSKYDRLIQNKDLIIPKEKFTEYFLNFNHPTGKNKAVVFRSALGYTLDNWADLEENIRNHLKQEDLIFDGESQYGKKFHSDLELVGANGKTGNVRTAWIQEKDSGKYRLITAYVL